MPAITWCIWLFTFNSWMDSWREKRQICTFPNCYQEYRQHYVCQIRIAKTFRYGQKKLHTPKTKKMEKKIREKGWRTKNKIEVKEWHREWWGTLVIRFLKMSSFWGKKQASCIKSGKQSTWIHSNAGHSMQPLDQ